MAQVVGSRESTRSKLGIFGFVVFNLIVVHLL